MLQTSGCSVVVRIDATMDDELMESMGGRGKRQQQQQTTKSHRTIQSDGTFLTLRHAFGVEGGIRNNVAFVTVPDPEADGAGLMLGYLLHPVGQQVQYAHIRSTSRYSTHAYEVHPVDTIMRSSSCCCCCSYY